MEITVGLQKEVIKVNYYKINILNIVVTWFHKSSVYEIIFGTI